MRDYGVALALNGAVAAVVATSLRWQWPPPDDALALAAPLSWCAAAALVRAHRRALHAVLIATVIFAAAFGLAYAAARLGSGDMRGVGLLAVVMVQAAAGALAVTAALAWRIRTRSAHRALGSH